MKPGVRRARLGDASGIARRIRETLPEPWTRAQVEADLALESSRAWVAVDSGGRIVAALLARRAADELEILQLAVAQEARRAGIARALVDQVAGGETGLESVHLEVRADNAAARAFYRAVGFEEQGCRERYYRDGSDAILLSRSSARTGR